MNERSLITLKQGETARISALHGGHGIQQRMRCIGIKEHKTLRVVAKHHFGGPLVVEIDGRQITLGRGMAHRVIVAQEK